MIRIGNNYLFSGEWWIAIFPGITLAALVSGEGLAGMVFGGITLFYLMAAIAEWSAATWALVTTLRRLKTQNQVVPVAGQETATAEKVATVPGQTVPIP